MKKFFSLFAALLFAGSIMATDYYLFGGATDWEAVCYEELKFSPLPDTPGEYILRGIRIAAGDRIKVMSPIEGSDEVTYYPSYTIAESYYVPKWGAYDIYFRPNGDGEGEDWYYGYFRLQEVQYLDFEYATVEVSNEYFEDLELTSVKLYTCDLDDYNTPTSNGILLEFYVTPDDPNDLNGTYSYQDFTLDVESSYLTISEYGGDSITDILFVDGEVTIGMTDIDPTSGYATLDLNGTLISEEGDIYEFVTTHSAEYDYYVTPTPPVDPDPQEEGLESLTSNPSPLTHKVLRSGHVVIYKNGVLYNTLGSVVQ